MKQSLKVQPTNNKVLDASPAFSGPSKPDCLTQISHIHRLRDSELNYAQHQHNIEMEMLRNGAGLHAPLKIAMELHAARKIGRLPFLQSSNVMEDVLLGRDEIINFSDILGKPEHNEFMNVPHVVMEKSLGIL